jgi:hypothetical protein
VSRANVTNHHSLDPVLFIGVFTRRRCDSSPERYQVAQGGRTTTEKEHFSHFSPTGYSSGRPS